jgi:two-component system, OmpR family, sensor histidine kinase VicK
MEKAIPARQRIREIEEGAKREFVETIRDPSEIQRMGFDLIENAEEEILILISTPNAFFLQERGGGRRALDLLKEAASSPRNVKLRILIAVAGDDNSNRRTIKTHERIQQLKELGIDVRRITKKRQENFLQNNNLTLLIADQSSYLTVELNDDIKKGTSEEEEIELATYSIVTLLFLLILRYLRIFGCEQRHNYDASYMALWLKLSDNSLKQAQSNTVFVQQEKVDRVGFEPTTSASLVAF